jgi:hypothetical protein
MTDKSPPSAGPTPASSKAKPAKGDSPGKIGVAPRHTETSVAPTPSTETGDEAIRRAYENSRILSDGEDGEPSPPGGVRDAALPAPNQPLADDDVEPESAPAKDDGPKSPPPAAPGDYSVEEMNRDFALVIVGSRALVIRERADGPVNDRKQIITPDAFITYFGNRFTEIPNADGKTKTVSFGRAWLNDPRRRSYEGIEFCPDPHIPPGTPNYLNLWRGFAVTPAAKSGGYKTFRDHLLNNVCAGDERLFLWVFAFFAHIVQRPRERIGVALVLRGKQGSGKTVVGEHFGALLGSAYLLVDDPRYVVGQFNLHLASCLLLQADEAVWAGDKAAEGRLKGLVTSTIQQIEAKGVDPIPVKNYVRLVMTSNESWVVPAGREERRFAVLDVNPRCVGNHDYFREMAEELADGGREALLHDLLNFDLATVDLRTIPKTFALLDQKERSLDSVPSWWLGRLDSGRITRHSPGWDTPVGREALFTDYLDTSDRIGVKRRREQTIFGRELHDLVPGLRSTRVTLTINNPDGPPEHKRERCYEFPPLADCRTAWDEAMGQDRDWLIEDNSEVTLGEREG